MKSKGKPVKVVLKDGRRGEFKMASEDGRHWLIEFSDGRDVDPADPMFPFYTEVVSVDDLKIVSA